MKEQFTPGQLLQLPSGYFEIGSVTEKAVMIKADDGRWGGNGYKPLWIPISIMEYRGFDPSKDRSQKGIHEVGLPSWFLNQHRKTI